MSSGALPVVRLGGRYVAWAVAAGFVAALAFCCWREPLAVDGWGHYLHRQRVPVSWSDLWGNARDSYLFGNPRLGQVITWLLYVDVVHLVLTPAVVGFVLFACCYLVAGRWPRLWYGEDWGLLALVAALLLVLVGNVGMMFFYRPYAGNYVYGFAFYLALLLPYRRALGRGAARSRWWHAALAAAAMLLLGAAAGSTNEHTGPAVVAGLVGGYLVARWRARYAGGAVTLAPWMVAGVAGVALGYAALLLAPGQMVRYGGLGREPFTRWVLERGWGNGALLALGVAPLLPALLGWAVFRRAPGPGRRRWLVGFFLAVSTLIVVTSLLSPKVGLRLFWPVTVLQVVVMVSWFGPMLLAPRVHRWTLLLSALVIAGHSAWLALAYAERAAEQAERLERLRAGRGAVVVLPCYRARSQHWLVADDVERPGTQQRWRDTFGVAGVRTEGAHCPRRAAPAR